MVDIHHHLLAGLDDGASNLDASMTMARMAAADGITHIVCTPHANERFAYDRQVNHDRLASLQQRLILEAVPITLALGCDFHLSYQNVKSALHEPGRFTINSGPYLLIELPDFGIPPNVADTFQALRETGLRLILTHPERNLTLAAEPQRMLQWLQDGMLVQVTADSVTGEMGRAAEKAAHYLLANHLVHVVATDAHNATFRPPRMRRAYDLIARTYGPLYAEQLCQINPGAIFRGEPVSVPELIDAKDSPTRKSWLRRLFQR